MTTDGGCFCGAVRYRLEGALLHASYCHCRMCQRTVGAPVVAWASWPAERFTWIEGTPVTFASSPKGERTFCPRCGSSLTVVDPAEPSVVDVSSATLDDPDPFAPQYHIWTMSRVRWLDLKDDLPRHEGERAP